MRRWLLTAAGIALLMAGAALKPARAQSHAQILTDRIAKTEAKLRTEKDPAQRKLLADSLEQAKHDLGPTDAAGKRVRCQAMWHDAALADLEADLKRLGLRAKPSGAAAAALEGRLAVRRMAIIGLSKGWAYTGNLPKFQFDALGTYLSNNLPVLDKFFDDLAAGLARENAAMPEGPDRDAVLKAIAEAVDGVTRMTQQVEQFNTIDTSTPKGRDERMKTLPAFVGALRTVYQAERTLADLGARMRTGEAAGPAPAAEAQPDDGPTPEDKAALEKAAAALASIGREDWLTLRAEMEKLLAVAEGGLKVSAARSEARQLVDTLLRTAEYVKELCDSKSAYPSFVQHRQESIAEAVKLLSDRSYRGSQYARLRLMARGDTVRRALDAGPLSREASQGFLMASRTPASAFRAAGGEERLDRFQRDMDTICRVIGQLPTWPPADMAGQLRPLYDQASDKFVRAAEALGRTAQDDLEAFAMATSDVRALAGDVQRLVEADAAIKAAAQYAPSQAAPLYSELVRRMERIILNVSPQTKAQERQDLDLLFQPLRALAQLRLPDPEHLRIVTAISGGAYTGALKFLTANLTRNLTSTTRGDPTWLDATLEARSMFILMRHRAVAQHLGLTALDPADLEAFSAPGKPWAQFVTALDANLRTLMTQYGSLRRTSPEAWQALWPWDKVFCTMAAAQAQTREARLTGEGEMARLLRHLEQAIDASPPDAAWFGWAIGYHTIEAAVCLAAGYDRTAGAHLSQLHEIRVDRQLETALTAEDFDPRR